MSGIRLVAITGRSGSGKSSVARYYSKKGYGVADGDKIARLVVAKGTLTLAKLVEHFGSDVLDKGGELNRQALAEKAFATPVATQALNNITHPAIIADIFSKAKTNEAAGGRLFFIDAAVIVGGFLQKHCDKIIVVSALHKNSVARILARDKTSLAHAETRLATQLPQDQLEKAADYIIYNNSTKEQLTQQADTVLQQLLLEV